MIWIALIVCSLACTGSVLYNAGFFHASTPALMTADGQTISDKVVERLRKRAELQGYGDCLFC